MTLLLKSTLLLAAFAATSGDRNFPSFATSDLMRHARANQLKEQPYNSRNLRNLPPPRKLRPAPVSERSNRRPAPPKKYKGKQTKLYDQNGNRVQKVVLPQVVQQNKPYYPPPPKAAPLKQRVVKAPRPQASYKPEPRPVSPERPTNYREKSPERPANNFRERPAYQYKRPEESSPQPTAERTEKDVIDELDDQPSFLQPRVYQAEAEDEEDQYTARSGPAFAPSNLQPSYAESPYGYAPPPEQRAIQEAVLDGANAYNSHDPEVYQNEDRLSFHIQGHDGPHSYRYGFDTGHGYNRQFRYEERDGKGYLKGRYGFFDKYGKLQVINYSADPYEGFHAEGAAVPEYPH